MKQLLGLLMILACVIPADAVVRTFQVTIGAAATQVSTVNIYCNWVAFQNNTTADAMRIGDSTVTASRGIKLLAGGSFFTPPLAQPAATTNLATWYVQGTPSDVIDIACDAAY